MVIKRSRQWVKDRIPAFICRDSNWLVSRWIQCNVFFCPECRQEYKSLKKVWDDLDSWEIEPDEKLCEEAFTSQFRQQFPSAFEKMEEEKVTTTADWLPTFAFAGMAALLLFVVMRVSEPGARSTVNHVVVEAPQNRTQPFESNSSQTQIAELPARSEASKRDYNRDARVVGLTGIPDEWMISQSQLGSNIYTTSSSLAPTSTRLGYDDLDRLGRTVEINNKPVAGFESLTAPYEEERPY